MKRTYLGISIVILLVTGLAGCQKGDLLDNPNAAGSNSLVPVSMIFNRLANELYYGGGVIDAVGTSSNSSSGPAQNEGPWSEVHRWNQFYVSLYSYYWGNNNYNWSNTATMYSVQKYVNLMLQQVAAQYPGQAQPYTALAKFLLAYQFVWYSQRVGDIPMSQSGEPTVTLTPTYDLQHDVYKNALALLDTANTLMAAYIASPSAATSIAGDIYNLTPTQWQKVINTYKLRVLISLSKRAVDNADLNIPQQFANIVNNPTQYPIMGSISDNLAFKYNATYNKYPISPNYSPYDFYEAMSSTFLNLTTSTQDPRTFIAATPAPAQLASGKTVSDFTAYVGADIGTVQGTLLNNANNGDYSYANFLRYFADPTGATEEPAIIIGYPEMCFNIAEAANRGWVSGSLASTWYTNGINASLAMYNLKDGTVIPIGDNKGHSLGSVTANVTGFLANVTPYAGGSAGLTQILTQKYIAFWQNSGWEAFYNWRRTGIPAFSQGGAGIATADNNLIPLRWQYPIDESTENTANWTKAVTSQYGGTDDITQPMWLIK